MAGRTSTGAALGGGLRQIPIPTTDGDEIGVAAGHPHCRKQLGERKGREFVALVQDREKS